MNAVTLENVTVSYARHPAVHHITGTFAEGSLTAITGPNGAGKSTLLKAIAGILAPDEGSIRIARDMRLAYLPQATALARDFPLTLLHLVCTGTWQSAGGFASITGAMQGKAREALGAVGLAGLEKRDLASLSAGQFQRALFARLMMQDAQVILLDEPFTAVDAATTEHLLGIIRNWHKEGRTVICVLHDFGQIRAHFPQCLLLARECLAWGATLDTLQAEKLLEAQFFRERPAPEPEVCKEAV